MENKTHKTISYSDIELKPMPSQLRKAWDSFYGTIDDDIASERFDYMIGVYQNEVELRRIKALNLKNKKPRAKKVYVASHETVKWDSKRRNYECGDLLDLLKSFPGGKKGFVSIAGITVNVTKLRKVLALHKYEFIKEIATIMEVDGEVKTTRWFSKPWHDIINIDNPNYENIDSTNYLVIQLSRDSFRFFDQDYATEARITFS